MDFETLEELNTHRRNRVSVAVITELAGGKSQIITSETVPPGQLGETVAAAFQSGKSAGVTSENRPYFINVYLPAPRVVIIGAVHIAQALVQMAKLSGFDILVIDPRTAFATQDRFGSAELIADWPEDVLPTRSLDRHTAVVALSHDPKIDDFPLAEALRTGCFYVGALGSRKTQKSRLERLQSQGFVDADLARIHGPIGLNIGAASPAEIAVSILAEIIATMRGVDALSKPMV